MPWRATSVVASVTTATVVASMMMSSSVARSTPVEPITRTECTDVHNGSGSARLCAEATRSEQGYLIETARLRTKSTVLATVTVRVTHDGDTVESQPALGFREVRAAHGASPGVSDVEVCAVGGVGIDSKDYGEVCVSLPPTS